MRDRPTGWAHATVLAVGDVDGDGQPDLVGRSTNGRYLHRGTVGTNPALPRGVVVLGGAEWSPAGLPEILAPGDVNGDGRADLLLTTAPQGTNTGNLTFLPGDAAGTGFDPAVTIGEGGWRWIQSLR
ncbi:FG-GAP repeat domain-containing protein [Streptomyces sp. NPDC086023]|uniref:FG-GAP repeat domain-containing protein n=1 Tax=Streptomyces sp. NPDC086023 TaxID=3365746 RepID=UPI0037D2494D